MGSWKRATRISNFSLLMFVEEKRTRAQNMRLHLPQWLSPQNKSALCKITEGTTLLRIHLKSVFFNFADNEKLKNRAMQKKLACYSKIMKQIKFEFFCVGRASNRFCRIVKLEINQFNKRAIELRFAYTACCKLKMVKSPVDFIIVLLCSFSPRSAGVVPVY